MAEVSWSLLTGPGDVLGAVTTIEAAADGHPVIAAFTEGGHVYTRRDDGTGWRWEHLGAPPGRPGVTALRCLTLDAAGTVAPVVVGLNDGHVWLGPGPATGGSWTDLGAPGPDTNLLSVATLRRAAGLRHVLVAAANSGRPWLREGLDPDGTWFGLAGDVDWEIDNLALASATVTPGAEPQLHVFAVVHDRATFGSSVRIGLRENSVWTWVQPGPPPDGVNILGLSATSFRDPSGAVLACAVTGVDPDTSGADLEVGLLIGAGHTWRWEVLGHPEGQDLPRAAVVVHRAVDQSDGTGPAVVARIGHDHWRRSPAGEWTSLGTMPGDTTVVNPSVCVEAGSGGTRLLWETGVSWAARLWTVRATGDGAPQVDWQDHGVPAKAAVLVGLDVDPPDADGATGAGHVALIDDQGSLYRVTLEGDSAGVWDDHDRPAPEVSVRAGVGTLSLPGAAGIRSWMFVIGSDGHLWARTRPAAAWSWVDHGQPSGRRVKSALLPAAAELPSDGPSVLAAADDGQLWLRTDSGAGFDWTSHGTPPGHLIFSLVGAAGVPTGAGRQLVTGVVADDGHLWLHVPSGVTPWVDLGAPTPTERVAAGIGAALVLTDGGPEVHLVVVTTPGGHAWTRSWSPTSGASAWVDLGRPADTRIDGGVGVLTITRAEPRAVVFLVGGERKLWTRDSLARDAGWDLWDRAPETDPLTTTGRAGVIFGRVSVVISGEDQRLWLTTSRSL